MTSLSFTPISLKALVDGGDAHAPEGVHERFEGVGDIQVVVDSVHGRRTGRSVLELKDAEAGFDPVWRRNGWGDCRLGEGFVAPVQNGCEEENRQQ